MTHQVKGTEKGTATDPQEARVDTGETAGRREWIELAGDGALATAAISSAATALVLLIALAVGDRELPVALQLLSAAVILLAGVGGPVVAWLAHGRPITALAAIGVALGPGAASMAFFAFVLLSQALGWALSSVNDAEWFGPLAGASLLGIAFLVLVAWLVLDAVRDLRPEFRRHVKIDRMRIAAGATIVVYTGAITVLAFRPGNGEIAEALAFMLLGAINGAASVTIADLAVRLKGRTATPV